MKIIYAKNAPEPIGPYSQAVLSNGMLYCSGQIPINPATGQVEKGTIAQQTELVFKNIRAVLKEAGADLHQVVKTTVFLSDMAHFQAMNEVYGTYFESHGRGHRPARSTIAVRELPKGVDVEIEVLVQLA